MDIGSVYKYIYDVSSDFVETYCSLNGYSYQSGTKSKSKKLDYPVCVYYIDLNLTNERVSFGEMEYNINLVLVGLDKLDLKGEMDSKDCEINILNFLMKLKDELRTNFKILYKDIYEVGFLQDVDLVGAKGIEYTDLSGKADDNSRYVGMGIDIGFKVIIDEY